VVTPHCHGVQSSVTGSSDGTMMVMASTMTLQRAVVTLLSVVFACLNSLQAARIAMMPLFGSHHFKVFHRLGVELQQRGHKVCL